MTAQTATDSSLPAGSEPLYRNRTLLIFSDLETVQADRKAVPALSVAQKFQISLLSTFDVGTLVVAAGTAGGVMLTHDGPYYGTGARGYGQAIGALYAGVATDSLFTQALFPATFHQDPRYFQLGPGHSGGRRLWYAISRTFIIRNDSARDMLNFSELGGVAAAVALSNTYYPSVTRNANDNTRRYGSALAVRMGVNLLREFFTKPRPEEGR